LDTAIRRHEVEIAQVESEIAGRYPARQPHPRTGQQSGQRGACELRGRTSAGAVPARPVDNLRAQALTANEGADFLPDAAREHMAREIERATTPTAS